MRQLWLEDMDFLILSDTTGCSNKVSMIQTTSFQSGQEFWKNSWRLLARLRGNWIGARWDTKKRPRLGQKRCKTDWPDDSRQHSGCHRLGDSSGPGTWGSASGSGPRWKSRTRRHLRPASCPKKEIKNNNKPPETIHPPYQLVETIER